MIDYQHSALPAPTILTCNCNCKSWTSAPSVSQANTSKRTTRGPIRTGQDTLREAVVEDGDTRMEGIGHGTPTRDKHGTPHSAPRENTRPSAWEKG